MGERHEGRGEDLTPAEPVPAVRLVVVATGDGVGDLRGDESDETGGHRRDERGEDHLGENDAEVDPRGSHAHERRPDQAAEKGMRGAGGKAEEPGEHVPGDRADEPREDQGGKDPLSDLVLPDDAARDRLRDLGGQEGAPEVQERGEEDGGLRLERAG
ncbi:hypothetical protein ABE10_01810, partial [Bacillus toyonensis]|nr:hypothetical protein [Bacillus toyonensis]